LINRPSSPYLVFTRDEWRSYREETPLPLREEELGALRGVNHALSLSEIEEIYLPLSRLLNLYVSQTQHLHALTQAFLRHQAKKVPYIIGICGSVAVGKSTTSRILQSLLQRWPNHPKVALISTDGFLFPNAVLQARGLMEKKGFPESYDRTRLIDFLQSIKSGEKIQSVPVYSHKIYDITGESQIIASPDILIIEGLNILQQPDSGTQDRIHVSDLLDFSIFVDAPTEVISAWYLDRFQSFLQQAQSQPDSFFHQFTQIPNEEALALARTVWKTINEPNLLQNILPFKYRANLILEKTADHAVNRVYLRKV
jgi:type I pantothenate kinase